MSEEPQFGPFEGNAELLEVRAPETFGPSTSEPSADLPLAIETQPRPAAFDNDVPLCLGYPAAPPPPPNRRPNLLDAGLFVVLLACGFVITVGLLAHAVSAHQFGLTSYDQAAKNTPIALGTQVSIYLLALIPAIACFQMLWRMPFFAGLHWHGGTAWRWRLRLLGASFGCNLLALAAGRYLPTPKNAPIDKMFATTSDAWMLTVFGVLIAPFFEEMIFRGFLLPAVATAWDWCAERMTGEQARPLDAEGNPVWSVGAMVFSSLAISWPFALMHSAQLAAAWGPLVLLYCVSLVLCAVRLATRSLAASTLVHSAYNFLLFAVMYAGTDGFRHLDKM